jgi:diaminohydroxyphosphoribosylaminopyrimidine deaminase / 5-amino-6-(5-phosphoribosylamino)uracil reductase
MNQHRLDAQHMARALALAARGQGFVEPNPMVGCVIAHGDEVVGEGWHAKYGFSHAEPEALCAAAARAAGATLYVNLEPCCHEGKTPACVPTIIAAGIRRVVAAHADPFPLVDGRGFEELRAAGIVVEVGVLESEARELNAPFLKLINQNCPWLIGKWAMTLDGKIATRTGESRWISGEKSREVAQQLRQRVDAIIVGRQTAIVDDPMLTARPNVRPISNPSQSNREPPLRIVLDSKAQLPVDGQLAQSAREFPTLIAVSMDAPRENCRRLSEQGCEVLTFLGNSHVERWNELLMELAGRRMTNVLVEGGATLLGSLLDGDFLDEFHIFIAPKLIGGADAPTPAAGLGVAPIADAKPLRSVRIEQIGTDVYISGRRAR